MPTDWFIKGTSGVNRTPSAVTGGSVIGYSSVGNGENPTDVTFPIAPDQIAMVQFGGSDWDEARDPDVSGDSTGGCFWTHINDPAPVPGVRYSGGGWITGDGTVTLSLAAMTGNGGGYINVIVVALGSSNCESGGGG